MLSVQKVGLASWFGMSGEEPLYISFFLQARDKQKATPLHEACTQGNPNVAKLLIRAGANLQARDDEKMTPLHYAAMSERVDCVKVVVDAAEEDGGTSLVEQIIAEVWLYFIVLTWFVSELHNQIVTRLL